MILISLRGYQLPEITEAEEAGLNSMKYIFTAQVRQLYKNTF